MKKLKKKSLVGWVISKADITKGFRWYAPKGRKGMYEVLCPWIFRGKDEGMVKVRITIQEMK